MTISPPEMECLAFSKVIKRGQIVVLAFGAPNGVMSLLNGNDFIVNIGAETGDWFQAPRSFFGFYSFVGHATSVEVVAVRDTTVRLSTCPIGRLCSEVRPGSLGVYTYNSTMNSTCILATDYNARFAVSGWLGSGKLRITDSSFMRKFDASNPPPSSEQDGDAYAISYSRIGNEVPNFRIIFRGGSDQNNWQAVTNRSRFQMVGRDKTMEYKLLTEEPAYPPSENRLTRVLLVSIASLLFVTVSCAACSLAALFRMCSKKRQPLAAPRLPTQEPPPALYDEQTIHTEQWETKLEKNHSQVSEEALEGPPRSPYQNEMIPEL
jgi:hypothetical protein